MTTIGKVNKIPVTGYDIEWQIPNFLSLAGEDDAPYSSPLFSFAGATWFLKIYPHGNKVEDSCIVFLKRESCGPSVSLEFSLGLKTSDGKKDPAEHYMYVFKEADEGYGFARCLSRSELLERQSDLMSRGVLTVFCSLKCTGSIDDANVGSLRRDFKKVLLDGHNHDLILKVGDKELQAHQDILRARSHVFESMLNHDMVEKNKGVIEVPDSDPQVMEMFLSYVYCGKVETLDQANMFSLYYIADKYDMEGLKEECSDFIKKSLSCANICKVIQLALSHNDPNLLECATEYFGNHVLDVLHSVEWQSFLKDNSAIANELLIKHFEKSEM